MNNITKLRYFIAILIILNILDATTTYFVINNGLDTEGNPTMAMAIKTYGLLNAMMFKIIFVSSIGGLFLWRTYKAETRYVGMLKNRWPLYSYGLAFASILLLIAVIGSTLVCVGLIKP